MNDTYIISIDALFYSVNNKRVETDLTIIENALIASQLGILFTLKTHAYVNFKNEYVLLNDAQLLALQNILMQYFNIDMANEIRYLVKKQVNDTEVIKEHHFTPASDEKKGFLNKVKGLFRIQTKRQEELV